MTRLTTVERAINRAPAGGLDIAAIADTARFTDGGPRQVAPLAWWLAHTGRVAMSPDCTRFRPAPRTLTCPACGVATKPVNGHRALCLPCTLADLDEPWEQIKARTRVVEKKAAKLMAGGRVDQVNLG